MMREPSQKVSEPPGALQCLCRQCFYPCADSLDSERHLSCGHLRDQSAALQRNVDARLRYGFGSGIPEDFPSVIGVSLPDAGKGTEQECQSLPITSPCT